MGRLFERRFIRLRSGVHARTSLLHGCVTSLISVVAPHGTRDGLRHHGEQRYRIDSCRERSGRCTRDNDILVERRTGPQDRRSDCRSDRICLNDGA